MKESFRLVEYFELSAEILYNSWLSSEKHSQMTGGEAHSSSELDGDFSAWDGYIHGRNKELIPNSKIVQSWRTTEFEESDEDSMLTIQFERKGSGTELILEHENIPKGQTQYLKGWIDHYFNPMHEYFQDLK